MTRRRACVLLFLPAFGTPLLLKLNADHPPDPCIHRPNECSVDNPRLASLGEVGCPRYKEGVFDGKVCLGCFRDDYEIDNWDKMSFAEKAYALEDASDRLKSLGELGSEREEVSISMQDLTSQSSLWMALAEKERSEQANNNGPTNTKELPKVTPQAESDFFATTTDSTRKPSAVVIPNIETKSTNTPTIVSTTSDASRKESSKCPPDNGFMKANIVKESSSLEMDEVEHAQRNEKENRKQSAPPPPTPCTRICRYNADCYNGNVCIGCFRDTHDIAQWSSMSPQEKMFSLEDAADRCKDLSQNGKDSFEGGITEMALREQAVQWGAWKG